MGSRASSACLGGDMTCGSRDVRRETEPEQARPTEETNRRLQSLFPVYQKPYMKWWEISCLLYILTWCSMV